jgi:hypothetical protein
LVVIFPILLTSSPYLPARSRTVIATLMLGNLFRESGVVEGLTETAKSAITNTATIFLGLAIAHHAGCFVPVDRHAQSAGAGSGGFFAEYHWRCAVWQTAGGTIPQSHQPVGWGGRHQRLPHEVVWRKKWRWKMITNFILMHALGAKHRRAGGFGSGCRILIQMIFRCCCN